ncbi:methyltransferase domain-containing protein [Natrarchaeobius chitinivorans]|uniref:Methyltransferase domain-containing protein n=1 Tax=Natrarchaeobius chitinivorans TaxID=1679083 RepID=A0A3N6LXN8_NATCH|nr:methyltransferase domain-containing protein [Natrarchaeobius chitinivorans]
MGYVTSSSEPPAQPPGPIVRVPRSTEAARDWYDSISGWYDLFADPFESSARSAGLDLLDATAGECVLDVGCGTGTALVELARAVGPDGTAVGIDVADGMCRQTRGSLAAAGLEPGLVIAGDAETLPFRDGCFDALFASFVLELFDTPVILSVLAEWRRVLDPSGRLCVVALSRRDAGLTTRTYERIHARIPTLADCRPIYVRDTLLDAGFRIREHRLSSVWRFPVDVVLCEPE